DERAAAPRRDVVVRLLGEPAARVLLDPGQAVRDVALGLADDDVVVGRPRDLADVAAQVAAVLLEHGGLVGEALGRAVEVRVLGVLRRDAQRLLLAAARDPQRDARHGALAVHDDPLQGLRVAERAVHLVAPALERARRPGAPHARHDLHALVERAQALARAGEPVPVGAPLVLVPARADAHLQAAARDVV